MRRTTLLILLCSLLIVAPVTAQGTLQPGVVSEVSEAAQTLGVINVIQFILVVGTVVLGVVGATRVVPPLVKAVTDANQQLVTMQAQSASVMQRMVEMTAKMENSEQAAKARKDVAQSINDHTDTALKPVVTELKQINESIGKLATKEQVDGAIKPIKEKLEQVIRRLEREDDASASPPLPESPPPDNSSA